MRLSNLALLILTCALGFGVFHIKYEVLAAQSKKKELEASIKKSSENIHILKAEWSHLNNPARLEKLSTLHLGMQPVKPAQIIKLNAFLPESDATPSKKIGTTSLEKEGKHQKSSTSTQSVTAPDTQLEALFNSLETPQEKVV